MGDGPKRVRCGKSVGADEAPCEQLQVEVPAALPIDAQGEPRPRNARKTEEEILIGTDLLSDCRLKIDFPARKVLISKVV